MPTLPLKTVTIHCAARLYHAPVLAAAPLVGRSVDPLDLMGCKRALHRGELNSIQMAFVDAHSRSERQKTSEPRRESFVGSPWPTWKAGRALESRYEAPLQGFDSFIHLLLLFVVIHIHSRTSDERHRPFSVSCLPVTYPITSHDFF